jgi:hypothetical protein
LDRLMADAVAISHQPWMDAVRSLTDAGTVDSLASAALAIPTVGLGQLASRMEEVTALNVERLVACNS